MPKIAALFELRDNVVSGCVVSLLRQFLLQAVLVQKAGYPAIFGVLHEAVFWRTGLHQAFLGRPL
jgi:hypothetical protein